MPDTDPSNPSSRRPPNIQRICPKCLKPMTLTYTQRDRRFTNLDNRFFSCECGATNADYVLRERRNSIAQLAAYKEDVMSIRTIA